MALLKDTVVSGSLRATDSLLTTTAQTQILKLPTASNGTTYGPGTSGHIVYSNGTSAYWGTTTGITSLGTVTTGTWNATVINPNKGGTGVNSYAKGDILYAGAAIANTATTALSKLTIGTNGQVLESTSNGIPGWITATDNNTASTIVKRSSSGYITLKGLNLRIDALNASSNTHADIYFQSGTSTVATWGTLWIDYPITTIADSTAAAQKSTRFKFKQFVPSNGTTAPTSNYEIFALPLTTVGTTGTQTYNILTTKNTLTIEQGGTGKTSWTQWGIVYASATNALAQVDAGSSSNSGYVLQSNGAAAPGWIQATNAKTASTIMKRDSNGGFDAVFSTIDSKFKIQYNASTTSLEFVYIS